MNEHTRRAIDAWSLGCYHFAHHDYGIAYDHARHRFDLHVAKEPGHGGARPGAGRKRHRRRRFHVKREGALQQVRFA